MARSLDAARVCAETHGRAAVTLGAFAFELRRSRKLGFFYLENADLRAIIDQQAPEGWTVEVVFRAIYLATHELRYMITLAERFANEVGAWTAKRIRRLDLCADFVGFPLAWGDAKRFVTQRAGLTTFLPEAKDLDLLGDEEAGELVRAYADRTQAVTGFSVGKGNALSARVYDKTAELRVGNDEGKRQVEQCRWAAAGWQGEPVTRVEFQLRGCALDELSLRGPDGIEGRIDACWQYCVRWLRIVELNTATRLRRCKNDRRWKAATSIVFFHEAQPAQRRRVRGGASAEHVLGAARSRLASLGILAPIPHHITPDGEVIGHDEYANRLSDDEAAAAARAYAGDLFEKVSQEITSLLSSRRGPRALLAHLFIRHDASCARFSSDDDSAKENAR